MSRPFDRLAEALVSLRQPAKVASFLQELLTPGEFHDLGLRWELVELLAAGMSQRQIAAKLGISLCKITRGAKILKKRNGAVAGLVVKKPARQKKAPDTRTTRKPAAKAVQKAGKGGKNGPRVARKS